MAVRTTRTVRMERPRVRTTTVTFSAADLAALGKLFSVAQGVLGVRFPVVAKLKAAMTRLGVASIGF